MGLLAKASHSFARMGLLLGSRFVEINRAIVAEAIPGTRASSCNSSILFEFKTIFILNSIFYSITP